MFLTTYSMEKNAFKIYLWIKETERRPAALNRYLPTIL